MTEQYLPQNINSPRKPRTAANSVATPQVALNSDDGFVAVDTTLAVGTALLPLASTMPGGVITLSAPVGATNSLEAVTDASNNLITPAGAPANPMVTDDATMTMISDGGDNWYIIAAFA